MWIFSQKFLKDCESCLCSQAPEAGSLAADCLAGIQSVVSKSTPMPQMFLSGGKTKDCSRLSRYSQTCELLPGSLGEVLLTSYLEGSRAKISQHRVRWSVSTASVPAFGEKWLELSAKYSRDSSSWKTHLTLFQMDLPESSVILPKWGMMLAGVLLVQTTVVPTMKGNDVGFWLTPVATQISSRSKESLEKRAASRLAQGFNTVNAGSLAEQVEYSGEQPCVDLLNPTTERFPTPLASDSKGKGPNSKQVGLCRYVKNIPTPFVGGLCGGSGALKSLKQSFGEEEARRISPAGGGVLSPDWVELLMGWPRGWTDLFSDSDFDAWLKKDWFVSTWERGVPRISLHVKHRGFRLRAIGNGQVPAAVFLAFTILSSHLSFSEK